MLETFDFSIFSGSFFRASDPGAPLDQSGTTGRSLAARAAPAAMKENRRAGEKRFIGSGCFGGERKLEVVEAERKWLAGERHDAGRGNPLGLILRHDAINLDQVHEISVLHPARGDSVRETLLQRKYIFLIEQERRAFDFLLVRGAELD